MGDQKALTLEDFEKFRAHPWVQSLLPRYNEDSILAKYAVARLIRDLHDLNQIFEAKYHRVAFTTIEGRVKTEPSLFRKLYLEARESTKSQGLTQGSLERIYKGIKDLAGVRFLCPYLDEVKTTIENLVRPGLMKLGYATFLKAANLKDKNFRLLSRICG